MSQGLIPEEDGQKMSKSRGNVNIPDLLMDVFGADANEANRKAAVLTEEKREYYLEAKSNRKMERI